METAVIITAIVVNIIGIGGMIFYAGRKIGKICQNVNTCSKNIGDLTLALNKTSARVQAVEIAVNAHTSIHKRYEGGT